MRKTIGILPNIGPHGGGSHQWTMNILHVLNDYRMHRTNTEVVVFTYPHFTATLTLQEAFPEVRYIQLSKSDVFATRVIRRLALVLPATIPMLRCLFPLNALLRREAIDLMMFPVTVLDSALCTVPHIFFMADIAHVFHPHLPEVREKNGLRVRHVIFSRGLSHANHIVVESEQLRDDIIRHYHADAEKINVVFQTLPRELYLGTQPTSESPAVSTLRQPYLFYPAQLWAHKNHANLLRCMALLVKEFSDLRLVLAGSRKSGDERIFALADELGLKDKISYLGYVPDSDIPTLYRRAAAMVMPTYFGPTNIPTLEAFYYGCPAVISDLPGVHEQVRDAALRFDPDQPEEMADKLRAILLDAHLREQLIARGRARASDLCYENYRDLLSRVLDKAMSKT
jgi:glycosyltransferase involved in cell wall biosynthesis